MSRHCMFYTNFQNAERAAQWLERTHLIDVDDVEAIATDDEDMNAEVRFTTQKEIAEPGQSALACRTGAWCHTFNG